MSNVEELIDAAIEDGVLTDTERRVLDKKALEAGWDLDEFHVILEGRLQKKVKEMNAVKDASKSKPSKYGEVRKCPSCGAVLKGGKTVCEECGYEVAGIEGVSSAERLAAELAKCSSYEREDVIKNFPIPNTVEDLLEFCLMCEARGKNDMQARDDYAYHKKYLESVNKAKVYFPNDPRFETIFKRSGSLKHKFPKQVWIGIGIALIVILALIMDWATHK